MAEVVPGLLARTEGADGPWACKASGSLSRLAPPLRAGGGVDGVDGVESGLEEPRPMFLGRYSTCNFCVAMSTL